MKVSLPLFLTLGWFLCGCETYHPSADEQRHRVQAQLRNIVVEDGISAVEADVIAQNYFMRFGPGCGCASPVTDGESSGSRGQQLATGPFQHANRFA